MNEETATSDFVGFFKMIKKVIIDGRLKCGSCQKNKELKHFFKSSQTSTKYCSWCKDCSFIKKRKIRTNHVGVESLQNENWKDIFDYEGLYQISDFGRVKSLDRVKILPNGIKHIIRPESLMKPKITKTGYVTIKLYNNLTKKSKEHFVHKLVLFAFVPNPENKLEGNHKFGIKTDNRVSQLEWNTRAENNRHAIDTGLLVHKKGSEVYSAKFTEEQVMLIRRFYRRFPETKQRDFAKRMNICYKQLNQIIKYRIWKHVVL